LLCVPNYAHLSPLLLVCRTHGRPDPHQLNPDATDEVASPAAAVCLLDTHDMQPGAVDVFLDFISYSGGPLPEQLLAKVSILGYVGVFVLSVWWFELALCVS
jgi:hypothetical protein